MGIFDYIINKKKTEKSKSNKLISYRHAAELICSCWNNLDVSIIEPYLDENIVWNGPSIHQVQGKKYYIKLLYGVFDTLKLSKRSYHADIVYEDNQYQARITFDHQDEDEVYRLEIENGLITKITIMPSSDWWKNQFSPFPFGVVYQTTLHEQAAAVAAIEMYVRTELGDKNISWATPYELKNSHCQLSFSCDGLSYDVLIEIQSWLENKSRFVMPSEYNNLIAGCHENDHIPCILALDEELRFVSLTLLEDMNIRVRKLKAKGLNEWTFRSLFKTATQLSQLVITKEFQIILPDYNNIVIKMEPLAKAVFLLFLRHPEGIIFKHLPDYRQELADIYQMIKPLGLNERAIRSIEDVTNPCLNSINEKCARIRGAFISKFDENLAVNYYITGKRGEAKKITLPRELVIWE